jgi:hypothetical protein
MMFSEFLSNLQSYTNTPTQASQVSFDETPRHFEKLRDLSIKDQSQKKGGFDRNLKVALSKTKERASLRGA